MNYKTLSSVLALQFLMLPCIAMEEQEKRSLSAQIHIEQTEDDRIQENEASHFIFLKDEAPITFTPRALYQAARSGEKRAEALLEYLSQMYSPMFSQLSEVCGESFCVNDNDLDHVYKLPGEHFTQKILDESLWEIEAWAAAIGGLFHIQNATVYQTNLALAKAIGNEFKSYHSKETGLKILKETSTEAVKMLEEQTKRIQKLEEEKTEAEKLSSNNEIELRELKKTQEENSKLLMKKTKRIQELEQEKSEADQFRAIKEAATREIEQKLQKIQEEYSRLTEESQEKEKGLISALQREADLLSIKTQLKTSLDQALSVNESSKVALEKLEQEKLRYVRYVEAIQQATSILASSEEISNN